MIEVINRKKFEGNFKDNKVVINVMRPSVLSNLWSHNPNTAARYIVGSRQEAVAEYKKYLYREVKKNGAFRDEMIRIYQLAKKHHVYLLCCCKPLLCHGDIIKEFLVEYLGDDIYKD